MATHVDSIFTEPQPSYIIIPEKETDPVLKELYSVLECMNLDIDIQCENIIHGNLTPCEYIRYSAQLAESKRYRSMVEDRIKSYIDRNFGVTEKKPAAKNN